VGVRVGPDSRQIGRLEFIAGATAALALPLAAPARGAGKRPVIAILSLQSQGDNAQIAVFRDALAKLGYADGKSATIVERYASSDPRALPALAAELAALKPDVVMADTASAIKAARDGLRGVPIVGANMSYPVEQGLITSFAHPGGVVTGMASQVENMNAKLIDIALELLPGATSVGLLLNPSATLAALERRDGEAAAQKRSLSFHTAEARAAGELEGAIGALKLAGVSFVMLQPNALFSGARERLAQWAIEARLPTVTTQPSYLLEAGILLSYSVGTEDSYRRAASYVDRILKGARPADLPVEFPTQLHLAINMRTAKALGLAVPPQLLAQADQVVE